MSAVVKMVNVSFQKQLKSNKYLVSGKNAKDLSIKYLLKY